MYSSRYYVRFLNRAQNGALLLMNLLALLGETCTYSVGIRGDLRVRVETDHPPTYVPTYLLYILTYLRNYLSLSLSGVMIRYVGKYVLYTTTTDLCTGLEDPLHVWSYLHSLCGCVCK